MKNSTNRRSLFTKSLAIVLAVVMASVGLSTPSQAADEIVSEAPLQNQPRVLDGRIYGIDSYGSSVVVAGTFTTIKNTNGVDQVQPYLFKFDVDTGLIDQNFLPIIDDDVDAVAISADGQHVFIAGSFGEVDGVTRRRIAKINMSDGSIVDEFRANTNLRMYDLALDDDKLFVGGKATTLNGDPVASLVALDLTTGDLLPNFTVPVNGTRSDGVGSWISELDLSADGRWLVVSGNFTTIDGQTREQLGVIEIDSSSAFVSDWFTDIVEPDCGRRFVYIRDVDIDPDSNFFVVNTTGWHRGLDVLCDSTSRFDLPTIQPTGGDIDPTWVIYTGGDTHWAAEVTEGAVYVGGHMRWENNSFPTRGNSASPGAVERPGIVALDPLTGIPLTWNPTRHRGRGVEAFHFNGDYLYVGSDTEFFNGQRTERLAVLPVDYGTTNPPPVDVPLGSQLHVITDGSVDQLTFDGTTFGASTTISGPDIDGIDWCSTKAAFAVNSEIISFNDDGAYYRRAFDGARVGAALNLSATVGYVDEEDLTPFDQPFGVAETTNAAYNQGRIFFTKSDSTDLFWRWHGLESGIIGAQEFLASDSRDWSDTTGMAIMGGALYVASQGNTLTQYSFDNGQVTGGTVVDNGGAGIDWSSISDLFAALPSANKPLTGVASDCGGGAGPTPPLTTFVSPVDGAVLTSGSVELTGSAIDDVDVSAVGVEVREVNSGLFLQTDGSFAATPASLDADVTFLPAQNCTARIEAEDGSLTGAFFVEAGAGASEGEYITTSDSGRFNSSLNLGDAATYSFTAPNAGLYRFDAIVQGQGGSSNSFWFQVNNEPIWLWNTPSEPTFIGDRIADAGVRDSLAEINLPAGNHTFVLGMREDGTRLDRVNVTEKACEPTTPSSEWSLEVAVPTGTYEATARAVDLEGTPDPLGDTTTFSMIVDASAPVSTIAVPADNAIVAPTVTEFSGTATDDVGVAEVRASILDIDADLWLQADGSFAAERDWLDAVLDAPDAPSTGWTLPVSLAEGTYRIVVKATDIGGTTETAIRHDFTIGEIVIDPAPSTTITSPTNVTVGAVTISGTATDDTGVDMVQVIIRSVDDPSLYIQADGSSAPDWYGFAASIDSPGGITTGWSIDLTISTPGNYRFISRAFDVDGNAQSPTTKVDAIVS